MNFSKYHSWWECAEGTGVGDDLKHRKLFTHVKGLEEDQADIHQMNSLNSMLYTNRELMTFNWDEQTTASFRPLNANLENVIQSVLDTLVSRVGKNRPKATIVTRGADFDVYLKGRQLDRYLWAEFLRQDVHKKGESVFLDSMIYGTGVLKVDIDAYDNELFCERVCPDEIVVDQRECVSCTEPQQLHHRRLVSRLWLLETYGDSDDSGQITLAIKNAQARGFSYTSYRNPAEDQIVVIESWKLPTRKGSSDGRHTICIENATLLDEAYTRDCFPFVFLRWNEPKQGGFYGRSLVEDLTGYQIRLNELHEVIRLGQDLMCIPRVWVDQGSAVMGSKFDTTIGRVMSYRGTLPEALTWQAFSAEIYNERDRIKASAFEFAGVSQFSAQNKLPSQARLDSSEALREYNAIEDERFNHQAQAFEAFYIDLAKHLLELSKELYAGRSVDRENSYRSRFLVKQIKWSEVDLEADAYVMQVSASSIINMSPAARKDKLNEWAAAGVITQEQYKAWSGEPDLERLADLMSASNDYIEYEIDRMLDGELRTPDPFANIAEGLRTVTDTYLHLRSAVETPEHILQGFRDWMELGKEILQPTAISDPMAASMGAPPMGPPGMPTEAAMGGMAPSMGPQMGVPPQLPPGMPTNTVTGAPAPVVSSPVAEAFVS